MGAAAAVPGGQNADSLGLDGTETFDVTGDHCAQRRRDPGHSQGARHLDSGVVEFDAVVRIDTPGEADYYRNGGILQYVLRSLMES